MPDARLAELIATSLPNLVHPGNDKHGPTPIPLLMFRNNGIPPEQAQQFAADAGLPTADIATLTAEAIVAVIETSGKTIIDNSELQQMRAAATANEPIRHRQLEMHCTCGTRLFKANITDFNTAKPKISPQIIRAMQQLSPECAVGHRNTRWVP